MTRFVALLRGVNVGRSKRVPMAAWCGLMEGLGYADVSTLLNSGNAVFSAAGSRSAAAHATAIRAALVERMSVDVPVIVKSAREVEAIVRANPFSAAASDPTRLIVGFAADSAALTRLAALADLVDGSERFHVGEHALYLWCPQGILQSRAGKALLGVRGREITTRNALTLAKIAERLGATNPVEARR